MEFKFCMGAEYISQLMLRLKCLTVTFIQGRKWSYDQRRCGTLSIWHVTSTCPLGHQEPPKPQKEQPPLPCSDDKFQAREGKMQNVQTSTRVTNPPGGKTHKLWQTMTYCCKRHCFSFVGQIKSILKLVSNWASILSENSKKKTRGHGIELH